MFPVLPFIGKVQRPAAPSLGAASAANIYSGASCTGGSCTTKSGTNDTIRLSWSITGADNAFYATYVYRDSGGGFSLQAILNNGTTTYDQTAPGSTGWVAGSSPVSYTYRVDVVARDDGAVVSSQTAPVFNETYLTTCPGPC